jgi:hypothetical protein
LIKKNAPSSAERPAGRAWRRELTLRPRTACGLPSLPVASWQVYAQATTSVMEGSVARGGLIAVTTPAGVHARGVQTVITLRFVPERAGMHQILIRDAPTSARLHAVGEVLVLQ